MPVDPRLRCLLLVMDLRPWFQSPWTLLSILGSCSVLSVVSWHFWMLFSTPRGCSAVLEVTQVYFHEGRLIRLSLEKVAGLSLLLTEVPGSDMVLQRLLAWAYSLGGH